MENITPELVNSVPNMVALIVVVILFLQYIQKRDTEWRGFLTEERNARTASTEMLLGMMKAMEQKVDSVDNSVKDIDEFLHDTVEVMRKRAQRVKRNRNS